jgi:hypothetical protein
MTLGLPSSPRKEISLTLPPPAIVKKGVTKNLLLLCDSPFIMSQLEISVGLPWRGRDPRNGPRIARCHPTEIGAIEVRGTVVGGEIELGARSA